MNPRATDQSAVSLVERVHELGAASVRTHPDVEARSALRAALVDLEQLREQLHAMEARHADARA